MDWRYMILEYAAVPSVILLLILIIILIILIKNSRNNKIIAEQAVVLRAVFDALPELVFCKDINGRYTNCNRKFEEFTGLKKNEIIGKTTVEVFRDIELAMICSNLDKKVLNDSTAQIVEMCVKSQTQGQRFFQNEKVPLINDGKKLGLLGLMRDVTEHKIVLDKTRQLSEYELMKYILTNRALHIALWDMDIIPDDPLNLNNKIIYSQEFRNMLGFIDANDFPNVLNSWVSKLHPDEKDSIMNTLLAHIGDREGNKPFDVEYRLMLKNGNYRFFRAFGDTLRAGEGIPVRIAGALEDITEKKLMQKDLENALQHAYEASKAKSDFLAKMSHEIRTPMNAIIGMTELALREYDYDLKNEYVLAVKQAGSNLLSIINDILDFSRIERGKIEIVPACYYLSSLVNDVVSVIRMRILDTQIRFAVNIDKNIPNKLFGDEIRIRQALINLLNNAVKYTERGYVLLTAYGEFLDANIYKLIFEVTDTGKGIKEEDIKRLFDDFVQLDLDKNRGIEGVGLGLAITNGIVTAMNGSINVKSEYGRGSTFTIMFPQKYYKRQGLASVNKPDDISILLFERRAVYINTIVYAFENLGVKYTLVANDMQLRELINKTHNFLFISFSLFKKNNEVIKKFGDNIKVIILCEFGESIPDKSLNVLAMPVYCTSIADILNGVSDNFSYDNRNEVIITFTAPRARVLIVDDINTNLKVAKGLLMPYNMQIDLCMSGAQAIDAIRQKKYDLVFMDHKMPGINGVDAVKRIRKISSNDPYYKDLPIVALTANAVSGIKEMFLESGFNDFLSKPIDTIQLNVILEKYIPKSKQEGFTVECENADKLNDLIIKGLDVQKGIKRTGGKPELYLEALNAFCIDTCEKIKEIEECLKSGNIQLYTIIVHALKSATAIIGAERLSETAKNLEKAGKSEDLTYIMNNNEGFMKVLILLNKNIQKVLNDRKPQETFCKAELKASLAALHEAISGLNAPSMYSINNNIRKTTYTKYIDEVIKKISDNILMGEYEQASNLTQDLMQKL